MIHDRLFDRAEHMHVRVRLMPLRVSSPRAGEARPQPHMRGGEPAATGTRMPLEVVEAPSKGRQDALKAWETRGQKQQEQARSEAARKAWTTRRENERRRKRSEAERKAWMTRRKGPDSTIT
jgi:hypothetical protein